MPAHPYGISQCCCASRSGTSGGEKKRHNAPRCSCTGVWGCKSWPHRTGGPFRCGWAACGRHRTPPPPARLLAPQQTFGSRIRERARELHTLVHCPNCRRGRNVGHAPTPRSEGPPAAELPLSPPHSRARWGCDPCPPPPPRPLRQAFRARIVQRNHVGTGTSAGRGPGRPAQPLTPPPPPMRPPLQG